MEIPDNRDIIKIEYFEDRTVSKLNFFNDTSQLESREIFGSVVSTSENSFLCSCETSPRYYDKFRVNMSTNTISFLKKTNKNVVKHIIKDIDNLNDPDIVDSDQQSDIKTNRWYSIEYDSNSDDIQVFDAPYSETISSSTTDDSLKIGDDNIDNFENNKFNNFSGDESFFDTTTSDNFPNAIEDVKVYDEELSEEQIEKIRKKYMSEDDDDNGYSSLIMGHFGSGKIH